MKGDGIMFFGGVVKLECGGYMGDFIDDVSQAIVVDSLKCAKLFRDLIDLHAYAQDFAGLSPNEYCAEFVYDVRSDAGDGSW